MTPALQHNLRVILSALCGGWGKLHLEPLIYLHVVNLKSDENRLIVFKGNIAS